MAETKEAARAAAAASAEAPVVPRADPMARPVMEAPQTSLATRGMAANEVYVQFRRYTPHGNTAYQRGQFAGFPLPIAEQLEARGSVIIDPAARRTFADRMVSK